MKNKFTLFSTFLLMGMSIPSFAAADEVPASEWKAGNYYQLKLRLECIALDGAKSDSLISKKLGTTAKKEAIDSTLWQITEKTVSGALVYEFKNKATGALLALPTDKKSMSLDPNGISSWTFNNGKIIGYYGNNKALTLSLLPEGLTVTDVMSDATKFTVEAPEKEYIMSAQELGAGLSTFYMEMGKDITGNPFDSKELVAKDLSGDDEDYVTLQYKGDETFPNGISKYLGLDTTRTKIDGAQNVFGINFKADSTYAKGKLHSFCNEDFQKFKFSIDLKNDSISLFVKGAPADESLATAIYQVVYASYENTKRLTVSQIVDGEIQGTAPFITTRRGEAAKLSNGSGVYILKNAGKGNGKYFYTASDLKADKPSIYLADGQWYVKEKDGKYSIVERKTGTAYAKTAELFPVNGMNDTYTVAGKADSITFEYQKGVDIKDKYLGARYMDDKETKDKAILLELDAIGGIVPITTVDSALVTRKDGEVKLAFKAIKDKEVMVGGAKSLGDTLYTVSYKLKALTSNKMVVNDIDHQGRLVLSNHKAQTDILSVVFVNTSEKDRYQLHTVEGKYITYNVDGNLIIGNQAANFIVESVDAPDYKTVESTHIRLESNGKYLAMNPLTKMAVLKSEGQVITKATYTNDHFALKIEKADTVIAGEPVYKISTKLFEEENNNERYYLSTINLTGKDGVKSPVYAFNINTKDTPAGLFAFKSCYDEEHKDLYMLEDVRTGKLISLQNEILTEGTEGLHFSIEKTAAPTAVETIIAEPAFKVSGGHNTIVIMNAKDKKVMITDILGKIVGNYLITSDRFTVQASRGINIVAVEGETAQKVIVK